MADNEPKYFTQVAYDEHDNSAAPYTKRVQLFGWDASGLQKVRLAANPSTGAMKVEIVGGSSSGTQYTEGDTDASITGTAVMWEDTSDTLRAVSASKPLPVDLKNTSVAVDQSGSWTVDIGSVLSNIVPGTNSTSLGKAEDAGHTTGDTGVMALGVRNDNASTTLSGTSGDYTPLSTDANGVLFTRDRGNAGATASTVAGSATSVTLLSSNVARRGATIYNDSSVVLYVKLGATASSTSYAVKMQPDSYYEVPFNYTGVIDGIWASATGNARITEVTAV